MKFAQPTLEVKQLEKLPHDQGIVGQWIDNGLENEEEDYYKKNAISKLEPEKAKELENMDKACRAKTAQEVQNESGSSDEEGRSEPI